MKQFRKVIVLGSGALKIGEAGEFDYSGSQAIKALKEEGITVVLVNPNIATIQTSKFLADKIYFLPVSEYFVTEIIKKEKPDSILLSFGGQTALNCGLKLHKKGILKKYGVQVLGTPITAIQLSEDRQKFANHLKSIGVAVPPSHAATNVKKAQKIAKETGYPVMIRAGYALGGQGSGIAYNEKELIKIAEQAFSFVPQVLVEKYLHHYKEVEYEVVRDKFDNCVTVCNMENMDPLGIHTGESVVIAPSQTLTNFEYHTLRTLAIKIVRSLKIVGECNVQFALNPRPLTPERSDGGRAKPNIDDRGNILDYYVIELNARLSRSSALASKATGYPLAYVAAKLALGKNLTSLQNKVTKVTQFCFEPALDYVTVKIPRWDINKFRRAEETIGSSMKSVGEVMGIGRTFEEAYQKAIRMLDLEFEGTINEKTLTKKEDTKSLLEKPTPYRIFALGKAFYEGMSVAEVSSLTGIDQWFLHRIKHIVDEEKRLSVFARSETTKQSHRDLWSQRNEKIATSSSNSRNDKIGLNKDQLLHLKQLGCSDKRIGMLIGKTGLEIRDLRKKLGITPSVFQIDTLAGEFPAKTNYLYMTYNGNHHDVSPTKKKGVIVLGSGPYRIGSSVEFDWTTVNTSLSLKKHKKQSIMVNCNPETVSTDYDISDRLYFEELTFERIADIYDFEDPYGVIISVGGQTPNNRAKSLKTYGCHILGTHPDDIDRAEDRNKFSALLDELSINQPAWNSFFSLQDAERFCNRVGYPVLIRPSYVLSGSNMKVCHNKQELEIFVQKASVISSDYPVVVSKFIENAKEIEVDCVAADGKLQAIVISEHIEDAGVHSGDATIVLPPQKLYTETEATLHKIAALLAKALHITGPFNIQCLAKNNNVMVIETNLRSSRTFPFISKATGIDFMEMSVDAFFGKTNTQAPGDPQLLSKTDKKFVVVKAAQFSFGRLTGADPVLDVEMASTGEVACFGADIEEAFLKAELSVGGVIPQKAVFITIGGDENKVTFLKSAAMLHKQGIKIYSTEHTTQYLLKNNIPATKLYKIHEHKSPNILEYFQKKKVDLAISIADPQATLDVHDDYIIRRSAVDHNIPLYTDLKKAALLVSAISHKKLSDLLIKSWDEYL